MIERLQQLTVSNFRAYKGVVSVPLDANVVLVYGENGTGKSSLMAGIEYALTGSVAELASLGEDYPRCLTHIDTDFPAMATVTCVAGDGVEQNYSTGSNRSVNLSERDASHFLNRCYLSQSRLSKLLEIYRQPDISTSEETLVGFIRELLGIDTLEALTDGLHEAGDIRRLQNAIESYAALRTRLSEAEGAIGDQRRLFRGAEWRKGQALDHLSTVLRASGLDDAVGAVPEQLSTLHERLQALSLKASTAATAENRKLQKWRYSLERARDQLSSSRSRHESSSHWTNQLERQKQRSKKLLAVIDPVLRQGLRLFPSLRSEDQSEPDIQIQQLIQIAGADLSGNSGILQAAKDNLNKRGTFNSTLEELTQKLTGLESELPSQPTRIESLIAFLIDARRHIEGDLCPVCKRDYGELGEGTLSSFLDRHVDALSGEADRLRLTLKQRSALLKDIERARLALEGLPTGLEEELEGVNQRVRVLNSFLAAVENIRPTIEEYRQIRNRIAQFEEQLRLAKHREAVRAETRTDLKEAASELDLGLQFSGENQEFLDHLELAIVSRENAIEQSQRQLGEAIAACSIAQKSVTEYKSALVVQADEKRRIDTLRKADTEIRKLAAECRRIRDSATEAKRRILEEAFSESLNRLWIDLFQRLSNERIFLPSLEAKVRSRGRIRAAMQAKHDKGVPFRHLSAVLSSGNVNTAALSLFLSLHLVHEPWSPVLLLDDPVQSMDDVHAVELVALLGLIVNQAGRQLVLAVHERALFEYLTDELSPSSVGKRLITIEIERADRSSHLRSTIVEGPEIASDVSLLGT